MRPYQLTTTSFTAADPDGVATSQSPSGAGNLTLVSSAVTLTPPRFVTITSAGNDTGVTFTITGTRPGGSTQTEVVTGANAGAATSTLTFETVTSIAISGASAAAVEAGFTQSGYSDWLPLDIYTPNQVTTISATVSGTVNYDIQYTNEDPFDRTITQTAVAHPAAAGAFTGATANQTHSTTTLMRAVRYKINSGTGTIRLTITQQSTA
jgi:hypothetical protein